MFYTLKDNQNIFIELTNPVHGGPGWEYGTCLWSPDKSKSGSDAWGIMKKVRPGDLIIHSLKKDGSVQKFNGVSIANSECRIINMEPPSAGEWANKDNYYRIDVNNFQSFNIELPISEFLNKYEGKLDEYFGSFFTKKYTTAQKYLAEVPKGLYEFLSDYFSSYGLRFKTNVDTSFYLNTNNTILIDDGNLNPNKITLNIVRTVRDTKIIRELKNDTHDRCQICGRRIELSNGKTYSEGHHLQPLGGAHSGPDIKRNVIILCPYHHAEFDYGSIAIYPKTKKIIHINRENEYNQKKLIYERQDLDKKYIEYHYKNIFNKL